MRRPCGSRHRHRRHRHRHRRLRRKWLRPNAHTHACTRARARAGEVTPPWARACCGGGSTRTTTTTTPAATRIALFPDTVSVRASRHAADLAAVARSGPATGRQAAAVFLIQRGDCAAFAPCHACDPEYGAALTAAAADGVLLVALRAAIAFQPAAPLAAAGGAGGEEAGGSGQAGAGTLLLTYHGPAPVDLEYGLADAQEAGEGAGAAKAGPKAKKARAQRVSV